jgi:hypothetical protein
VRRAARLSRVSSRLSGEALKHFGMPASKLDFAARLEAPLYTPTRSESS